MAFLKFITESVSDTAKHFKESRAEKKRAEEERKKNEEYILAFNKNGSAILEQESIVDKAKDKLETRDRNELICSAVFIVTFIDALICILRYFLFFSTLHSGYIWSSMFYIIPFGIGPFFAWVYATDLDMFNYHKRKYALLVLCLIHYILLLFAPILNFEAHLFFPHLTRIKITQYFSTEMVVWLGRLIAALFPAAVIAILVSAFGPTFFSETFYNTVAEFKLCHVIDKRKNADTAYDLSIFNDLETGDPITVMESDRFVHTLALGATGTGKTSMACLTAIESDLTKRCENEDNRNKKLLVMVAEGHAFLNVPKGEEDGPFKPEYVVPLEGFEDEYRDILKRYRPCGVILLAPDEDVCNKTMDLCIARGIKPRLLDPTVLDSDEMTLKYGDYLCGLNPLYSPVMEEFDLDAEAIHVTAASKNFADVLDAIDALHGNSGDKFFSGVNRNLTRNVAAVAILYHTHNPNGARQANFADIQTYMQDFTKLEKVISTLHELYGDAANTTPGTLSKCLLKDTAWEATFANVRKELIDTDRAKENYGYAYGLRNIIDEFIADPRIKRVFTTGSETLSGDKLVDFDRVLRDGEVVVCNYALNIGENTAVGFGNFFQISFNLAVFRRPLKDADILPPVFEHCDEISVLASAGWLERTLALFRKYKVGFSAYLQSLDQMNKSETTRYLKGLFLGVGTQIIYGRAGTEDMKIYSQLAGADMTDMVQQSVNETSMLDDASYSYGERTSSQEMANLTETQVRYRDFAEVTLLTIRQGRVLKAISARGHFLPDEAFNEQERYVPDLEKLMAEYPVKDSDKLYYEKIKQKTAELKAEADKRKMEILLRNNPPSMVDDTPGIQIVHKDEKLPAEPVIPEAEKEEEVYGQGRNSYIDDDI